MLGATQYHTIPLPKGWPRRLRSAVIQVFAPAHVARRVTPSRVRAWPAQHCLVSLAHYTYDLCLDLGSTSPITFG